MDVLPYTRLRVHVEHSALQLRLLHILKRLESFPRFTCVFLFFVFFFAFFSILLLIFHSHGIVVVSLVRSPRILPFGLNVLKLQFSYVFPFSYVVRVESIS